jgi:hypothetical protein
MQVVEYRKNESLTTAHNLAPKWHSFHCGCCLHIVTQFIRFARRPFSHNHFAAAMDVFTVPTFINDSLAIEKKEHDFILSK